jgi:hypothetical protein
VRAVDQHETENKWCSYFWTKSSFLSPIF